MKNRDIDRNDLLATTRAEFLRGFSAPLTEVIEHSTVQLFESANNAPTLMEQSRLRDARGVLLNQGDELKRQLLSVMEQMLNRSFQTAYSTFRPSFGGAINASNLSLVDTSAFEDELHIDVLTKQLRDVVEEPLRDLNIRIALLFEQDDIKERENPFRPYLFVRTIATALENIQTSRELIPCLTQQLVLEMEQRTAAIYDSLNSLLAANGIAANLQLKVRKSSEPSPISSHDDAQDSVEAEAHDEADSSAQHQPPAMGGARANTHAMNREQAWSNSPREAAPVNRVDQLLEWVQGIIPGQFDSVDQGAGSIQSGRPGTAPASGGYAASGGGGAPGGYEASEAYGASGGQQASGGYGAPGGYQTSGGQGAAGEPSAQPASTAQKKMWLSGAHSVGKVLREFFSSSASSGVSSAQGFDDAPADFEFHARAPFANADLTHAIYALQHTATPDTESMHDSEGRIRNLILEHRDELSNLSQNADEQMIIDVVAMLFEFILRDPKVPAEVRAQLGRLQFLVLKVALLDPEMFTHKNHPARMLVNRIGSVVQDLQQIDPEGQRVPQEIRRIVEVLLADSSGDSAIFSRMLDEFDAFVAKEIRSADTQVDQVVQVLENAESRTVRFARTTALLAEALSHLKVDDYLHDFLVNTWTRVVERAGRDGVDRALRLRQFVPDLIWSIAPKVSEQDRRELFGLIPVLLDTLSTGVFSVGWNAEEQKKILDWLVDVHRHALRSSNLPIQPPPRSYINELFESFVCGTDADLLVLSESDEKSGIVDGLDGKLLDEAISEMEIELTMLDKMLDPAMQTWVQQPEENQNTEAAGQEPMSQACPDDVLERLRSGVAIEITLDTHPAQAYLNWVSSVASNMVISIDGLASPSVISRKVFRRLWSAGRVKFLEDAPLFERAVQALLASADEQDHHLAGLHG